jgi:hypothetical protein
LELPILVLIALDRDRPFDGVFAHLWRQCSENPHNAGLIAHSASDEGPGYECHMILSEGKPFASNNTAVDHSLKIDLKEMCLIPSGYSVKTHETPWNGIRFGRSWRFEGSNDDSEWEVHDSHTDPDELMENDKEVSFAISATRPFRFLRLIVTGMNSSGNRYSYLQRLETFGVLTSIRH